VRLHLSTRRYSSSSPLTIDIIRLPTGRNTRIRKHFGYLVLPPIHITFHKWDFYFRALRSLVVLSFPQPLNFSSVFPSL
jgi:hypothetical protein